MSLAACGSKQVALLPPPAALTADCPETATIVDAAIIALEQGTAIIVTNGDLVRKIRALRLDLQLCNADKAGLRAWNAR